MIQDNQKYLNRIYVVFDILITCFSFIFAWYLKFRSGLFSFQISLSYYQYMKALVLMVPYYIILYNAFHLYVTRRIQGRREELANIIKANIIGLLGFILVLYLTRQADFSRIMLFIFFCLNVVLDTLVRNLIRGVIASIRKNGYNNKNVLLIGYSHSAEEYIDRVLLNPQWGYVIRGILDDNMERGTEYKGIRVLGTVDNLNFILPQNKLDEIIITLKLDEYHNLGKIVSMCEKSGVHTKFIPDYSDIISTKPYTEDLVGLPVINIRHVPLNNTFSWIAKRAVDIFGALVALILFSPIMLTCAIIIKVTSPGPLIFKQERVGLHNKNFYMYKFRSMVVQDEKDEKKGWTVKNDPRVTPIGKFIRKTSIDEMPQFINVLKGDMSLVGPRPERPQFVEKFKEEIPRYMIKHQVRPGLTGWAQVNGLRGDTSIKKRIDCDLYYIENWSMGFDFKILFLTFFKGFVNKNAY